jgi:hypothetical protein
MTNHRNSSLLAFLREPGEVVGRVGDIASERRAFAELSGDRDTLGIALLVVQHGKPGYQILVPRVLARLVRLGFPYIEEGNLFY